MEYRRKYGRDDKSDDHPIYSRLFVICDKKIGEDDIRNAFSEYGKVDDVYIPKDHDTGEPKGVAYVKFSMTSEAAKALEGLHGKHLSNSSRPIKVRVASNRSDIQSEDAYDKYRRLFIYIQKDTTENEIDQEFKQFGVVQSVNILRDRNTDQPKGFAYVKFRKFSEAALAMEQCDKKYRAIFAQPKAPKRQESNFESNIDSLGRTSTNKATTLMSLMNNHVEGYTNVHFMCCPKLNKMQIERLFDIVPGMLNCQYFVDLVGNFGKGSVSYSNPISAAHAVEKLNEFEYPPGLKIFVKPNYRHNEGKFPHMSNVTCDLKNAIDFAAKSSAPDLVQLTQAVAEATKIIKSATVGVSDDIIPDINYCSAKLPPQQPLADMDSPVAKRCFLVCKPQPPPLTVLRDIFCRFGDLINVYTLPNKTVGFARYASVKAADEAIKVLHGAEVCGIRIKVIEADEEVPNKRVKYEN